MNTNAMTLRDVCISAYPILDGIMNNLTATEVSAFLYALHLLGEVHDSVKKTYMNVRRDLGYVEGWVDDLLQRGDPVVLAGRDLSEMEWMYKKPETYWNQKKVIPQFTLWCLGMSRVGYQCRKAIKKARATRQWYQIGEICRHGIAEDGTIKKKTGGMMKHGSSTCFGSTVRCDSLLDSDHMFVPGPGTWRDCYWNLIGNWADKYHSTKVNNITLHFGSQFSNDHLVVDSFPGKSMPDITGYIEDLSTIKYMNMKTNKIRYAIEDDYLQPENIRYLDGDMNHIENRVLQEGEMSASVEYFPRDASSDGVWFEILFE